MLETESALGHSAAGKNIRIEDSSDYIGNRTRDLPVCSIVPQSTSPPHGPEDVKKMVKLSLGSFNLTPRHEDMGRAARIASRVPYAGAGAGSMVVVSSKLGVSSLSVSGGMQMKHLMAGG